MIDQKDTAPMANTTNYANCSSSHAQDVRGIPHSHMTKAKLRLQWRQADSKMGKGEKPSLGNPNKDGDEYEKGSFAFLEKKKE